MTNGQLTTTDLAKSLPLSRFLAQHDTAVAAFREFLQQGKQFLQQRFEEQADIESLLSQHAWLVDQIIQYAWPLVNRIKTGLAVISLIAVGGYGRGQLHPHSDIDLLILVQEKQQPLLTPQITELLHILWDVGLKVGHSVRTLKECCQLAAQDLSVITNLMESRYLLGSKQLYNQLLNAITTDKMWPMDTFLEAKWQEQLARHSKYANTAYNLEPNVKLSPGGLRDLQMLSWLAQRQFAKSTLFDLVNSEFLTAEEYDTLISSQHFIWRVRYGLHSLARRDENRLLFEYQPKLAQLFGFIDSQANLAVEKFMQQYYRAAIDIARLNDLLLQHFREARFNLTQQQTIVPVNARFQLRNHYLEVTHSQVFADEPSALLELFLLLAAYPNCQGVRAATIRLVRSHSHMITGELRYSQQNTRLFNALFDFPARLYQALDCMHRYDLLGRYLPIFGEITGKMQYDLFHVYTVDAHTLLVIKQLAGLLSTTDRQLALANQLIKGASQLKSIFISALFHDLGKGKGGDHSMIGAEYARSFCLSHHFSEEETELVCWLVAHHLLLSTTAQHQDISDPQVVNNFAAKIVSQERLDCLFLLTVADIKGTNPKLWNSWRAALLHQLYDATSKALAVPLTRDNELSAVKAEARQLLAPTTFSQQAIESLWRSLNQHYFLYQTAEAVAAHTEAVLQHKINKANSNEPVVLVRSAKAAERYSSTEVFIYCIDQPNLFVRIVKALEKLDMTIHDAQITVGSDGYSANSFVVLQTDGKAIATEPSYLQVVQQRLQEALIEIVISKAPEQKYTPKRLRQFNHLIHPELASDLVNQSTLLKLTAPDRPGLLVIMAEIFVEFKLNLLGAKIVTLGDQVKDIFWLVDKNKRPLKNKKTCQKLVKTIYRRLEDTSK